MNGDKVLTIKNMEKSFNKVRVLNIESFSLLCNEKLVINGQNGSGKSTLLKIIKGILNCDNGELKVYCDSAVFIPSGVKGFYGYLTAKANIEYYLALNNIKLVAVYEKLSYLAEVFKFTEYLNVSFDKLSLGNKQKCILIANLLIETKLLLIDEPTAALDIESKNVLANELLKSTSAMLIITHDIEFIKLLKYDVCVMDCGSIMQIQSYDKFINSKYVMKKYQFKLSQNLIDDKVKFENGYYIVEDEEMCKEIFKKYDVLEFKVIE